MNIETIGCIGNTIITSTGNYVDFVDPKPETIDIRDIAKGLSNCCRFAGQCDFYSVAEHSVLAANIALTRTGNELFALSCLLHDASEAYTGDVSKPLKIMLPEFKKIEDRLQRVIEQKFSLPRFSEEGKKIDLELLKFEKEFLFSGDFNMWSGFDLIDDIREPISIVHYKPRVIENMFLRLFESLK